ncbi:glycerol kinase GlpK [Nitrospirillum sp. BR 11828]|uniref:glycerol kinase GlpK n=1 Tax=Nitrospirillum sp. BR 11828 TaxID=3104325 RepID=UPI002ACA0C3E|nr:glycerol kinase GlpK [Nitrospirillum sp. BR 11828]MDZ5646527.1 glycerol kinase GlpK [Nitrospirillum sp. BR 11828]
MPADLILAIDQGTTSTRAILFNAGGRPVATAQRELPQHYPADGQVEHDPEDIWRDTVAVCRGVVDKAGVDATRVAAIGITNQRETTVVWDRRTGEVLHPAIVWQDRRTAGLCQALRREGAEDMVRRRTGLLLDPYFSATKLAWILDTVPGARARAEAGELAFGTIDCFLLWRLTGGQVHATDATNAARTLLFNLETLDWDPELLRLFGIPAAVLPRVLDNAGPFGIATADLLGRPVPVLGMAGDQQAAAIGQACLTPGMIKSTYGTGCFALMNIGDTPRPSHHRLLTTLAYRLDGRASYALEGSIFVAGAAVQWLRDGLRLIPDAAATQGHATALADTGGVYLVPAFTGLGAPYWDPDARGAILGLTRDSGVSHIVRAALESVCYQTRDLMDAMAADGGCALTALRVDGGMVANDWLMQFLADQLDLTVERPAVTETTALGAAFLAGLAAGLFPSLDAISGLWREERRFEPAADPAARERLYDGWRRAVGRVRTTS